MLALVGGLPSPLMTIFTHFACSGSLETKPYILLTTMLQRCIYKIKPNTKQIPYDTASCKNKLQTTTCLF